MKLLNMQSSLASCHFLRLRSKYSFQYPVLFSSTLTICCSPSVRDKCHIHKARGKFIILCILIPKFLGRRTEAKRTRAESNIFNLPYIQVIKLEALNQPNPQVGDHPSLVSSTATTNST